MIKRMMYIYFQLLRILIVGFEANINTMQEALVGFETNINTVQDEIVVKHEEECLSDNYFYANGTEVQRVNVKSTFTHELPDEMDLVIKHMESYSEGDLYELYLDYEEEFPGRFDDGWDRLHLGYFYVCEDKIYRVKQTDDEDITTWDETDFCTKGSLVCCEEQVEDMLEEDEIGFHERIDVDGELRTYVSYENYGNTNFFEGFTWEKEKGLVSYRCGYGALSMYLEIYPSENKIDDEMSHALSVECDKC